MTASECSATGCTRARKSRGMCNTHYERWRKGVVSDAPIGQRGGLCSIPECHSLHYSRGWCELHYSRWRSHGDPTKTLHGHTALNFWAKVSLSPTCWEWTASLNNQGYGIFWDGGKPTLSHKYSYQLHGNALTHGMVVDHRCGNPSCVNPLHLRLVTDKQNNEHRTALNSNNTSGIRGVYWDKARGKWHAQVCHNYRTIAVGRFTTREEAELAVVAKRNELFTHNDRDRMGITA